MDTRSRLRALEKRVGAQAPPAQTVIPDEPIDALYEHVVERVEQAHHLPEPHHYGYQELMDAAARAGMTPLEFELSQVAYCEHFITLYEATRGAH